MYKRKKQTNNKIHRLSLSNFFVVALVHLFGQLGVCWSADEARKAVAFHEIKYVLFRVQKQLGRKGGSHLLAGRRRAPPEAR